MGQILSRFPAIQKPTLAYTSLCRSEHSGGIYAILEECLLQALVRLFVLNDDWAGQIEHAAKLPLSNAKSQIKGIHMTPKSHQRGMLSQKQCKLAYNRHGKDLVTHLDCFA